MSDHFRSNRTHAPEVLEQRARHRRHTQLRRANNQSQVTATFVEYLRHWQMHIQSLPLRFVLHGLVFILLPLAVLISRQPIGGPAPMPAIAQPAGDSAEFVIPLAPLVLDQSQGDSYVPDSAFAAIDALPLSPLPPGALEYQPIVAAVSAELANIRSGPGTDYDTMTTLTAGASIHLLERTDDWYKVQVDTGQVAWIAAAVLEVDPIAADWVPLATSIPPRPPPKVGQVIEASLNLRDGPGTGYVGIMKLNAGDQLDLIARYQDWLHVQSPAGQLGWVTSQYLAIDPGILERVETMTEIPDPNPERVGRTTNANINLRSGPATAYEKIATLGSNMRLELLAQHRDWYKVRTANGTVGWISDELINVQSYVARRIPSARSIPALPTTALANAPAPSRQMPSQFAPASTLNGSAQFAIQFIGARYVWGGASPQTGFDCSGFTQYVYAQYGLALPHSSEAQFSTRYGSMVSDPASLQPGDIVFFVNTYKRGISHVGIYIGGGDVVQGLTPGRGVGIANLSGGYWATRYYGAIRPNR